MSLRRKIKRRAQRREKRVRQRFSYDRPRISVFRSLHHVYAQVIDDKESKTVVSASSLELDKVKGDKKQVAHAVGLELAKRARKKGLDKVAFDRGSFRYHGRLKALADGLREGGLEF